MIKISLNGVEKTYNSLAHAVKENGATSGMNRENALKFLAKLGFDISSLETADGEKITATATPRAPKKSIIEMLIDAVQVVDTKAVNEKQAEINSAVATLKNDRDIANVKKLMKELEALSKPVATLETIQSHVANLFNAHQTELKAKADEEAKAKADAEAGLVHMPESETPEIKQE